MTLAITGTGVEPWSLPPVWSGLECGEIGFILSAARFLTILQQQNVRLLQCNRCQFKPPQNSAEVLMFSANKTNYHKFTFNPHKIKHLLVLSVLCNFITAINKSTKTLLAKLETYLASLSQNWTLLEDFLLVWWTWMRAILDPSPLSHPGTSSISFQITKHTDGSMTLFVIHIYPRITRQTMSPNFPCNIHSQALIKVTRSFVRTIGCNTNHRDNKKSRGRVSRLITNHQKINLEVESLITIKRPVALYASHS